LRSLKEQAGLAFPFEARLSFGALDLVLVWSLLLPGGRGFGTFEFGALNLFRISCFGFRISRRPGDSVLPLPGMSV
jgi:hypothetical protein